MSDRSTSLLIVAPAGIRRSIVEQMVDGAGVKDVRIASNSEEARDLLEARLPAVVIVDWSLPNGDCEEVLRYLRGDRRPERLYLPIVTLNAETYGSGPHLDRGFGVQASLPSPHSAQDLMVAIAKAIGHVPDMVHSEALLPWTANAEALRIRLH
ncbi:hypothetical protein [Coralliovum pocilloporae]|uniref:hypothetical protein n=1 Tax=Coralliovum pocilloporae TaxID=3066369 RepID=UPI0033076ED7